MSRPETWEARSLRSGSLSSRLLRFPTHATKISRVDGARRALLPWTTQCDRRSFDSSAAADSLRMTGFLGEA